MEDVMVEYKVDVADVIGMIARAADQLHHADFLSTEEGGVVLIVGRTMHDVLVQGLPCSIECQDKILAELVSAGYMKLVYPGIYVVPLHILRSVTSSKGPRKRMPTGYDALWEHDKYMFDSAKTGLMARR